MNKAFLNLFCAVVLVISAIAGFAPALAASDDEGGAETLGRFGAWQNVGPLGGDVRSLAIDLKNKNKLYFGTLDGQVYASYDGGQSWQLLVNFNRPQLVLDNLIIDPRDSRTIYVSGHRHKENGGFFKTTDGGKSWREADDLKGEAIHSLTQSTSNPDMLVAGSAKGIFISDDAGNSWEKVKSETAPVEGLIVDSLAVDPRNTDVMYAGTTWRAYKTTNGGKDWRLIKEGMIDDSDVFAIDIDPRNADHIIASACSGIYESRNAGETWKKIQGIPSQSRRTRAILQHPSDEAKNYVFAGTTEGFWRTADGGTSWTLTTSRQLEINSIAVHPDEPNKIFIGTNNYGVMVSNDFGKNFSMTNGGFSTRLTNQIVADIEKPNRLYASTINTATGGGFFFVSNDGGMTWQPSMKNWGTRTIAYSILQDAAAPDTIYLGTNFGIYRSLDRGASWAAVTPPKPKKPAARRAPAKKGKAVAAKKPAPVIETKPTTPEPIPNKVAALSEKEGVNVLLPTRDGKNGMYAATDTGLYRTYDLAQGWERLPYSEGMDSQTMTMAISAQRPEVIWVGTARSGVLVSRDGGKTWTQDAGVPANTPIRALAIDPERADYIYVGTKQMFFLTRDGGENWQRRGGGIPSGDFVSIIINPRNPNEIFVGNAFETRGGAYRSMDAGMTWERLDSTDTALPSRRVWALAFDPHNGNRLFVGSHSGGIYVVDRSLTAKNE
jgi:photosystem II stability/assembly factor-like uncharacterized protein